MSHLHQEIARLKAEMAQMFDKLTRYEAQIRSMAQDVKLLNFREKHWEPGWQLPMKTQHHGERVFAEATYRESLGKHMEAEGEG